jgi:hypothetical protein
MFDNEGESVFEFQIQVTNGSEEVSYLQVYVFQSLSLQSFWRIDIWVHVSLLYEYWGFFCCEWWCYYQFM